MRHSVSNDDSKEGGSGHLPHRVLPPAQAEREVHAIMYMMHVHCAQDCAMYTTTALVKWAVDALRREVETLVSISCSMIQFSPPTGTWDWP